MKNLHKLVLFLSLILSFNKIAFSQSQLTVTNYSACPCQSVSAAITWNNVSGTSYTLIAPSPNASPPTFFSGPFSMYYCSNTQTTVTYTLIGNGTYNSAPISQTIYPTLTVLPPAPLSFTPTAANSNFCFGGTAQITTDIGGSTYSYTGSAATGTSNSNIITIPGLTASNNGTMQVTSVINGCTVTGVATINVSPNNQIAVNSPSSVCQGANVNLIANLASNNSDFQWFDPGNSAIPTNTTTGAGLATLNNVSVNNSGVYTVTANLLFNGILCPRSATTQVNVVQTSPVVPSASPDRTVCQGTQLNLSANAPGCNGGFVWTGPQSYNQTGATQVIYPAVPSHSGTYTVVAKFVGNVACTTSAVITISVVPVAQPVISAPANVCESNTAVVTMTVTSAITPTLYPYEWTGPSTVQPVSLSTYSIVQIPAPIQPTASGTYYAKAKYQIGNTTCISTASTQLNVVPVNTVSVISPVEVCSPANAYLQSLANGANAYNWAGPNGFTYPGANAIVYYPTPSASGIYTVTAYFGGGNITCPNSNTMQLTVNSVLHFSLIPRQMVCYNTPVTITGPSGATTYTWTSSTGFTSNSKDISFSSIQPNNTGTYTLNVSLGPCKSGASSEIVVLTPIEYSLTPKDRTVCKGDTILLEVAATGGSENYAYEWIPSVYLPTQVGSTQVAVPLGSVLYNVIAHDIACPNFTIGHAFYVNVNVPPTPTLQLNQVEGCPPLSLFLNSQTQKDAAITMYDFGDRRIVQRDSFLYTLNEPGTYTLKVHSTGKNGCRGTYEYPAPVIVYPKSETEITWTPEVPTTRDEVTFHPVSQYEPVKFSWSFSGGVTPGDTNKLPLSPLADTSDLREPVRFYDHYGKYGVMLITITDMGCIDTVGKIIDVIDELQLYVPSSFTPNDDGINDVFAAKGTGVKVENYSMEIIDRWGTSIFSTRNIDEGWDGKVRGVAVKDGTYIYIIRVVGMNGEGRKEVRGFLNIIK
jgi:gliding motility-associated-like protein